MKIRSEEYKVENISVGGVVKNNVTVGATVVSSSIRAGCILLEQGVS